MDNDFCNNYGYLEIFGGIYLRKFPLLTKRVRGRIETFSMSGNTKWNISSKPDTPVDIIALHNSIIYAYNQLFVVKLLHMQNSKYLAFGPQSC